MRIPLVTAERRCHPADVMLEMRPRRPESTIRRATGARPPHPPDNVLVSAATTADDPSTADNRERWLTAPAKLLQEDLRRVGCGWTEPPHLSVGFPSGHRAARRCSRVGECWDGAASADGRGHVFVSPSLGLGDADRVLATLLHELVHLAVGVAAGHRGAFARSARALGFEGPLQDARTGPRLSARLAAVRSALGPYPHPVLRPPPGAGASRVLKATCGCDRPRILRLSRSCYDEGPIHCGVCRRRFLLDVPAVGEHACQ